MPQPQWPESDHDAASPQRPIIVHPTDFAPATPPRWPTPSRWRWRRSRMLRLLLVRVDNESFYSPTQGLRQVRDLLVGWGRLGPDAAYDRLAKELDLQVSSVSIAARNARAGILEYLRGRVLQPGRARQLPQQGVDALDSTLRFTPRLLRKGADDEPVRARGPARLHRPDDRRHCGSSASSRRSPPASTACRRSAASRRCWRWSTAPPKSSCMHVGKRAPELDRRERASRSTCRSCCATARWSRRSSPSPANSTSTRSPCRSPGVMACSTRCAAAPARKVLEDARWPLLAVPVAPAG